MEALLCTAALSLLCLVLSHSPSWLISMLLRDVPIHKKPAVGWTKLLEGTKQNPLQGQHSLLLQDGTMAEIPCELLGFHRQVNNALQQAAIY